MCRVLFLSTACCKEPHVHLWSAASQQVDQSGIEGHDGVAHVNDLSFVLARPEADTRMVTVTIWGYCDNNIL